MDLDTEYTFVALPDHHRDGFDDKTTRDLLAKWGLKADISIQSFSFNEPFRPYLKKHFVQSFFKDPIVAKTLKTKVGSRWANNGVVASDVVVEDIPCSVLTMKFFERLRDPANDITHDSNKLRTCMRYNDSGEEIGNNLTAMFLDPECDEFKLYDENERAEFIFRLARMLVVGGKLCQYEDTIEPYMETAKLLYKDLIKVEKREDELRITTMVLKVVARSGERSYFPVEDEDGHNFAFLLIDSSSREVKTFLNQRDSPESWDRLK